MINNRISLIIMLTTIFFSCNSKKEVKLNGFQKKVKTQVEKNNTTDELISVVDTIFLNIENDSLDSSPIFKVSNKSIIIANPYLKNIYKFDMRGDVICRFGKDGDGPGEFRSILDIAIDEKENIYAYDFILNRLSKFNGKGKFLFSQLIKNTPNIRHIAAFNNNVYLHHTPNNNNDNFISEFDSLGFINSYLNSSSDYINYYFRGFLDGGLISDKENALYETNCYSYLIKKITSSKVIEFGERPDDYDKLKITSNSKYENLRNNYIASTIHGKIFLTNGKKLLLQEFLKFYGKNLFHFFHFYDSSGVFLGKINIGKKYLFRESNGDFLIEYIDPYNFPLMKFKQQNPFVVFYKILE